MKLILFLLVTTITIFSPLQAINAKRYKLLEKPLHKKLQADEHHQIKPPQALVGTKPPDRKYINGKKREQATVNTTVEIPAAGTVNGHNENKMSNTTVVVPAEWYIGDDNKNDDGGDGDGDDDDYNDDDYGGNDGDGDGDGGDDGYGGNDGDGDGDGSPPRHRLARRDLPNCSQSRRARVARHCN